jgi:hypothetical protein
MARRRSRKYVPLPEPEHWPPVTLDNGQVLNEWESKFWWALTLLKIRFTAQQGFGRARSLGGALVDFYLPEYHVGYDPAGPHHYTDEGAARDWWREVTRAMFDVEHRLVPPEIIALPMGRLKHWIIKDLGTVVRYGYPHGMGEY